MADGVREFVAVAVVTDTSPPAMPCSMCLETLTEFAKDLPVLAANLAGERRETRLARAPSVAVRMAGRARKRTGLESFGGVSLTA